MNILLAWWALGMIVMGGGGGCLTTKEEGRGWLKYVTRAAAKKEEKVLRAKTQVSLIFIWPPGCLMLLLLLIEACVYISGRPNWWSIVSIDCGNLKELPPLPSSCPSVYQSEKICGTSIDYD